MAKSKKEGTMSRYMSMPNEQPLKDRGFQNYLDTGVPG